MAKVFGHRGASGYAPENTMVAFALAAAQGADGVELDVRLAGDGSLIVHHDAEIPGVGDITNLGRRQIPAAVPSLIEVVDGRGGLALNIEIKNLPDEVGFDPEETLAAAVARLVEGVPDVLISSFNPAALARVKEEAPSVATGWLTLPLWDQHQALGRAVAEGRQAIHPHHLSVNADLCRAAHDAGLAVNTWTVDDPERMAWLVEAGVDAIITNLPDIAVGVLKDRRRTT